MKIKYDFNNNYVKYQNEAYGIAYRKKRLKKNPNTKITGFLAYSTKLFSISFFPLFILMVILYENSAFLDIMTEILTIILVLYFGSV